MERLGGEIFFGCCFFASATAATQKKKAPGANHGALIREAFELFGTNPILTESCETPDICRPAM
jgi:hypothetical protein